jgi:hypothetical protein
MTVVETDIDDIIITTNAPRDATTHITMKTKATGRKDRDDRGMKTKMKADIDTATLIGADETGTKKTENLSKHQSQQLQAN